VWNQAEAFNQKTGFTRIEDLFFEAETLDLVKIVCGLEGRDVVTAYADNRLVGGVLR